MSKIIKLVFLEPDIQASEKRIRDFAENYNDRLKNENGFLEKEFQRISEETEKGKGKRTYTFMPEESYKSLSIKSSYIDTAVYLLRAYMKHQEQCNTSQDSKAEFIVNNSALETMKTYSRPTAWRHINRLLAAGILTEKTFRGSNTGFALKFNTDLLEARYCRQYNDQIVSNAGQDLDPKQLKEIYSLKPSFSDSPYVSVSTCNHIALPVKEHKKSSSTVKGMAFLGDILQKTFSPNSTTPVSPPTPQPSKSHDLIEKEQKSKGAVHGKNKFFKKVAQKISPALLEKVKDLCYFAWITTKNQLWGGWTFTPQQEADIIEAVAQAMFEKELSSPKPDFDKAYTEFSERIAWQKYNLNNNPHTWVPGPMKYFNPMFLTKQGKPAGYRGTGEIYQGIRKKREEQSWQYENLKIVSQCCKNFLKDKTTHQANLQRLGKKKDKIWLEIYLAVADDNNLYSQPEFQALIKQKIAA